MREVKINASTPFEQVQAFCRFAEKFKSDFFSDELSAIRTWSLEKLLREIRARYLREQGEQIIRPLYYWLDGVGGDCDDATVQYMAYFRACRVPAQNIIVSEAREPENDYYTHIFCALETEKGLIILDNLPESQFNRLDYPPELCRFTRMSEYL